MGRARRAGPLTWGLCLQLASLGCATRPTPPLRAVAASTAARPATCPDSLRSLAPEQSHRWLWLRPRALFDHPQLGPLLSRLAHNTNERALLAEAERVGIDPRTVERALLVDQGDSALTLVAGAFDTRRVIALQWDRMLPPQRRGAAGAGVERIEGMLGGRVVALSADGACGLIARAERDPRLVDRLISRREVDASDPPELIRWHLDGAPSEVSAPDDAALTATLRWTELRADATADGLRVTIVLAGPLPSNTPARMTRLLSTVAASPLGGALGADDWLHPTDDAWSREGDEWRGAFVVPWRGLRALVAFARGSVEAPDGPEF
jgi:hypothetical protein